jgi:hypothetical protein
MFIFSFLLWFAIDKKKHIPSKFVSLVAEKRLRNKNTHSNHNNHQSNNLLSSLTSMVSTYSLSCYQFCLLLFLHFFYQISFLLYNQLIPILLLTKFKIGTTIYEIIYLLSCLLGCFQLLLMNNITIYNDGSYYFMMIGTLCFFFLIWIMIESERIYDFLYHTTSFASSTMGAAVDSMSEEATAAAAAQTVEEIHISKTKLPLYSYVHITILIMSYIWVNSIAHPLTTITNLLTFSSIQSPSFIIGYGTWKKKISLTTVFQGIYSMISLFSILFCRFIIAFFQINTFLLKENNLLQEGGIFEENTAVGREENQNTIMMTTNDERKVLYLILFFLSIHLLFLSFSEYIFETIYASPSERYLEMIRKKGCKLGYRHWIGIAISLASLGYSINYFLFYDETFSN